MIILILDDFNKNPIDEYPMQIKSNCAMKVNVIGEIVDILHKHELYPIEVDISNDYQVIPIGDKKD